MRALLEGIARRQFRVLSAVLCMLLATVQGVTAQTDVIRGRVTGVDGSPLAGVRVTATSIPGNVTREAQTNAQGNFQIPFPNGTGDYMMGYALFGYNYRQLQLKRVADEAVLVADVRLAPIQLDEIVATASVQQRVNRNATTPDVGGTERGITPDMLPAELQGSIAAMAASLPGVTLLPGLDGEPDGFSVMGLGADQNSTTLNGMSTGMNNLPRDAGVTSSLATSPFDVSRGGFSGGNFNLRSQSGNNFKRRGMSFVMTAPQMQWTDRAAQQLGNDYTDMSLSAVTSGPLKMNKAFYNVSVEARRNSRNNQTLLGTSDLGLLTAGIASDSVTRFVDILNGQRVPIAGGPSRSDRISDRATLFGSIDFSPPSSSSGQSIGLNFNANYNRTTPTGSSPFALESAAGEQKSYGAGVQARHSGYLKMVLSESTLGFNLSGNESNPYLELPGGRVRVNSVLEDGGNGVQNLTFGGNQGMDTESRTTSGSFMNSLSWFDNANKHRIKLSTEVQYNNTSTYSGSNLLGTFSFNSLADLEAGRPASFSRTLTARERSTSLLNGSISLGDSYRHNPNLQFQFGVRLDANHYLTTPSHNPLVEQTFSRRNDDVPTPITFSPRIGFSWTLGQSNEIAAFTGAFRGPRAVVRGGIGVFANNAGAGQLNSVLDNTGLPGGVQQIMCVGPAVPIPNWEQYAANPGAVPTNCANGADGTVFSNSAPNVSLFASDYAPPKTIRSNLAWSGGILDARFNLNAEATYSLNLNQQRQLDLNFLPTQRFTLGDDGRPVFVEPTSIVTTTGSIGSRDARVSNSFARVTELRSDLKSRTGQLSLRLSPIPRTPTRFGWSLAYTFTHVREQVSGFNSTADNPLSIEWARSGQGPHQISYSLRYRFFDAVDVSWSGSLRSGYAFTPTIAGDINGDGYSNDRAFVFSPSSANDPALAAGMQQLLDNANDRTRACLDKQLGRIADRNSCRGPWTTTASLNVTLDRAKFRMPSRASVQFSLQNPLGAADMLVNGTSDMKGWGQSSFPDQQLLYVRGFDPQTRQYRYEVNQRFGATRPQFTTSRNPVVLSLSMRYDLGATREKQQLGMQLANGRTQAGSRVPESLLRSMGTNSVVNPMTTILRSQDSLRLSAMQADSIAAMNRRYMYRADSLWTPIARHLATLPVDYDYGNEYDRYLDARRKQVDMLTRIGTAVSDLLTPEQRRKLPFSTINFLDPRYLALIRNGTGLYVTPAGGGGALDLPPLLAGAGIEAVMVSAGSGMVQVISR